MEARSQVIDTRRFPSLSIKGPPKIFMATRGASSKRAINPVLVGLPVVSSTNHGSASIERRVPTKEMALEVNQP